MPHEPSPGRVQKIITDLIASNAHGAWSVTELCKHIYPDARMEKKHRVAVTRALRKMVLPWGVLALRRQGNEYCPSIPMRSGEHIALHLSGLVARRTN